MLLVNTLFNLLDLLKYPPTAAEEQLCTDHGKIEAAPYPRLNTGTR
jgi:hypothetical protein